MKKLLIFVLCALTAFGTSFSAGCAKEEQLMLGGEPVSVADSKEYLVKDGASDYKIVISANASKTEKYAAEELRYFIEKSTAVKLPIDSDANGRTERAFIGGKGYKNRLRRTRTKRRYRKYEG